MTGSAEGPDAEGVAARRTALEALARVEDDGAYANLVLGPVLDASGLEGRDRGLVTDLVYGTIRRQRALDHLVDRFLTDAPPPAARRALRLGAYQVTYRDDIPPYAAVSATVGAAPKRFRGLVNAVLRRVAGAPLAFPDRATELSYPEWVLERLEADLGEDRAFAALASMNEAATVHSRADGYVQDLASQWVVEALGAAPGEVLVDLCAAPGGKATGMVMGQAAGAAFVVAADLQAPRVGLIAANAARVGAADVAPLVADALHPPLRPGCADRVLVDAPCSGLGVLRRRPDARWRVDPDAPERLARLQTRMVDAAVGLLRPGGVLAYSVCTLTAVESLGVDDHVRAHHPDLVALPPPGSPWVPWGRGALLLPQAAGTDGMSLFRYRRGDAPAPDS